MDSKHGKKGARLHQPERASSAPYHSQEIFIKSILFFSQGFEYINHNLITPLNEDWDKNV